MTIAMFPLGSVLFPHMPLQLRVFEDRYLTMLSTILDEEPAEFGVVLIERGQEVGGGEKRFTVGTVAQIAELEGAEGFVGVLAHGARRIEITEWLDDAPFPQAEIRELPDLEWDDNLTDRRLRAESTARRTLALASEFMDQQWSATVELSDDEVESSWQLAAIAPLGPLDQVSLLRSENLEQLLGGVIELSIAAEETFRTAWTSDDDIDGEIANEDDQL